jgi:hypothetical protein
MGNDMLEAGCDLINMRCSLIAQGSRKTEGENVAGGDYLYARISEQLVRERANQRGHRLKKTAIEGDANVKGSRGFLLPGLYGNQIVQ